MSELSDSSSIITLSGLISYLVSLNVNISIIWKIIKRVKYAIKSLSSLVIFFPLKVAIPNKIFKITEFFFFFHQNALKSEFYKESLCFLVRRKKIFRPNCFDSQHGIP